MNNKLIYFLLGLLFIAVGIWVFKTPVESYIALSTLFSLTFLINGILEVIFYGYQRKRMNGYGWGIAAGILDIILGSWLLSSPLLSMEIMPFFIGFMLLFRSSTIIALAIDVAALKRKNWGWYLVFGILGLIFSFLLIWNPLFAQMTIIVWTALAFITVRLSTRFYAFQSPDNIQQIL